MKDILIVEDSNSERERLEKVFQEAGYSTVVCESVGEAERQIAQESFRLAILDIGLNDRSGSHLFATLKRGGKVSYIIIFTGNPSVHLKQRFLDEGAVDYVVKASHQAKSDQLLARVQELIGEPQQRHPEGVALEAFLGAHVPESSRKLFLDMQNSYPPCKSCGSQSYVVTFAHETQMPPEIRGLVVCSGCGTTMNLDIE